LARKALALGGRRFAILGPKSPSGTRLAAAFRGAVEAGGGTITGHITYAPASTTFSNEVQSLRKLAFDALFVPDDAGKLELIAPALAVADIWSRPVRAFSSSARDTGGRRDVFLLSTAVGVSQKLVQGAERYVQGALLCPGFYPAEDARAGNFVSRFRDTYGAAPTATDAYGHDALLLLRTAVERGARTRADLLRALGGGVFEGATGDVRFGPEHGRIDTPTLYVVDGTTIRTFK
jgi:ABC-type branched-subunit amino acid transport system substrate-binding protein